MPYLTLIGGPCPQSRARCDAKFTVPVLKFGGVPYIRDDRSTPDDMIYVAAGHCEHEWSSWFLIRHRTKVSEFTRMCLKCDGRESMPFELPTVTEQVPEAALDETRVYDADDTAWIVETAWPTGFVGAARLPVEGL